jgi:hypothetical protein
MVCVCVCARVRKRHVDITDTPYSQSTYTGSDALFYSEFQLATSTIPLARLGIGLETYNEWKQRAFTSKEV